VITVEIDMDDTENRKEIVRVYFDKTGLMELQARLGLIEAGKADHVHLMSESWGLGDLSEDKVNDRSLLVHHLELNLME